MKVKFYTLGCKVNTYETEAMEQQFMAYGYDLSESNADIYVINTCAVTNIAERKSRQMIRRAKEQNPKALIVVCGCYAQTSKEEIEKMLEVDIVIGVNEKTNIVKIVEDYLNKNNIISTNMDVKSSNSNIVQVSDVMHQNNYLDFSTTTYTELNRAVVKVQDGCDRFCSYCIIPYARGKVRSRNPESVLREIVQIAQEGIKEVVITGIHLASFGKDFSDEDAKKHRQTFGYSQDFKSFDPKDDLHTGGFRLIELLEQINKVKGIERIRLGSLEPKLITREFVTRLSKLEKICPHFHLSLQSGCDKTLKDMNRRYTTEEFENSANLLRKVYPEVALTTDIIVGFPNETDEDFEKTYEFLKKIRFYKMHIFKYSPKKGTVAIKMKNQVDGKIKEERSKKLIELSNENQNKYNESYIEKTVKVLFEEYKNGYFKGHTANYIMVNVKGNLTDESKIIDKILNVEIVENNNEELYGKIIIW